MHGPTCIPWADLTHFSLQAALAAWHLAGGEFTRSLRLAREGLAAAEGQGQGVADISVKALMFLKDFE